MRKPDVLGERRGMSATCDRTGWPTFAGREERFSRLFFYIRTASVGPPDIRIAQVRRPRLGQRALFPRNPSFFRRSCAVRVMIQQDRLPIFVARLVFPEDFGLRSSTKAANLCGRGRRVPNRAQRLRNDELRKAAVFSNDLRVLAARAGGHLWRWPGGATPQVRVAHKNKCHFLATFCSFLRTNLCDALSRAGSYFPGAPGPRQIRRGGPSARHRRVVRQSELPLMGGRGWNEVKPRISATGASFQSSPGHPDFKLTHYPPPHCFACQQSFR